MGHERDVAGDRVDRRERGVHPDRRVGVGQAHAVRPDDTHPVSPGRLDERGLHGAAVGAELGKPGTDDHDATHVGGATLGDHVGHGLGGNGDDRHVGAGRRVTDARIGVDAADRLGERVDGQHRAGEAAAHEVVHQLVADGARSATGADDSDRGGAQDATDRCDHGSPFAFLDVLVEHFGWRQREADVDDAGVEVTGDVEPCVAEDVHHRPVVGQGLGVEALDAVAAGDGGEVFEHHGRQTAPLLVVFDDERDLGRCRFTLAAVVAHDGHDQPVELGDQREPFAVVDLRQSMELGFGNLGDRREEPEVDRLRRQPPVQGAQLLDVVGADRADVCGAAVGQHHIALPLAWIYRGCARLGQCHPAIFAGFTPAAVILT